MKKILLQLVIMPLPWSIRRFLLEKLFGFKIHKSAKIGKSIILTKFLEMHENSRIHNFVLCKKIDKLVMKEDSGIGNFNLLTGFSVDNLNVFKHVNNRKCELILGKSAGITSRHFIDCNGGVYIGDYTTIAGIRTQILTHSIDVYQSIQTAKPIHIGKYCFIGTSCILLPGTSIPDYSILAAGSVVTKKLLSSCTLYGGNPAKEIKKIDKNKTLYFKRTQHVVK